MLNLKGVMVRVACVSIASVLTIAVVVLLPINTTRAENSVLQWAEGNPGTANGANRDYYNRVARLKWKNFMGDWADVAGQAQGSQPFASSTLTTSGEWASWDVTNLVTAWMDGTYLNQGFDLRGLGGGKVFNARSKESTETAFHPRLVMTADGTTHTLAAEADTYLDSSTFTPLGRSERLRLGGSRPVLIRFDLSSIQGTVTEAWLEVYPYESSGSGNAVIGVFRSNQTHMVGVIPVEQGLAAKYPGDVGIENDPDVLFFESWEQTNWEDRWTFVDSHSTLQPPVSAGGYGPLDGQSWRVENRKGETGGANAKWRFSNPDKLGAEPEEMYFRYYVRLDTDWHVDPPAGNKFPGFAGIYGTAGNGGNQSDGTNGWSARGHYYTDVPIGNPAAGLTAIGNYVYHADMQDFFGDLVYYQRNYLGLIERNRWYCIEQYLKMNTPGVKDGILRAWVDGQFAYEKTTWRWRSADPPIIPGLDQLRIEDVWLNVHHGGTIPTPESYHMYFDNLVIAHSYIGPMAGGGDPPPPDTIPPGAVQHLEVR